MPSDFDVFMATGSAVDGPDWEIPAARRRALEQADVLVVTCAQNAAPVHRPFFNALRRYCERRGAELAVLPIRYRNPTSPLEAKKARADEWRWPDELHPHLVGSRLTRPGLIIFGDLRIQATAQSPLVGLESISRGENAILGHAQVAMETVPAPQHRSPAILHTTGSVSRPRYSQTKAGARGHFHHTLGALVVERGTRSRVHLRHVTGDHSGGFFDLGWYYPPDGRPRRERPLALVTGDTHVDIVDEQVVEATYGSGGLVEETRPERLVWHDVLDFSSRSHWDDPLEQVTKLRAGRADVRAELERACAFIREKTPRGCQSIVVWSNHHDHLRKWVLHSDWRSEGANSEVLLELAQAMVRGAKMTRSGVAQIDPFAWWAKERGKLQDVRFLSRGETLSIGGVEVSFHGHLGPGGARGSRRNLDRIGVRLMTAHAHGPGIFRGVHQVGTTSRRDPSYTRGSPSNWLATHGLIGRNGKKQLVTILDGERGGHR